jgi:hypothetical protein
MKNIVKPSMSEKEELWWARGGAGVAVVIAGLFGIYPPGFVAQVVAFAFGLAAASFFPAILMGIFNKKMNKEGAIAGMVVGIIFTAAYIWWFKYGDPACQQPGRLVAGYLPGRDRHRRRRAQLPDILCGQQVHQGAVGRYPGSGGQPALPRQARSARGQQPLIDELSCMVALMAAAGNGSRHSFFQCTDGFRPWPRRPIRWGG